MVRNTIRSISPLMEASSGKKYCKIIFEQGLDYNWFINSKQDELTYSNLKPNSVITFETKENNGNEYILWISNIDNKLIFEQKPKEASPDVREHLTSPVGSASQNNDRVSSNYPTLNDQIQPSNREILIIMQSLLKCVAMNSKKETSIEKLYEKAKKLYNLLMEVK